MDACFKIPAQIVATGQTIERAGEGIERVDGIAIISPKGADQVPVGAILPNNELQSPSDDRKTVEGTIEPNTIRAQIVAAQPEKLDDPLDDADRVAITGQISAADVPVRAARPSYETETLDALDLE